MEIAKGQGAGVGIEKDGLSDAKRKLLEQRIRAVSYTHLDVYKRQTVLFSTTTLRPFKERATSRATPSTYDKSASPFDDGGVPTVDVYKRQR